MTMMTRAPSATIFAMAPPAKTSAPSGCGVRTRTVLDITLLSVFTYHEGHKGHEGLKNPYRESFGKRRKRCPEVTVTFKVTVT